MPGFDEEMVGGCTDGGVDHFENADHKMVGFIGACSGRQLGCSTGDLRVTEPAGGILRRRIHGGAVQR